MNKAHIQYGFGLRDFNDYGINFLTGEACGYGGRILADLDERGVLIMEEFLGTTIGRGNHWNRGEASMMIPRGMIADLAVFCLIKAGHEVVVSRTDYTVRGFTMEEWMSEEDDLPPFKDRYLVAYPDSRIYFNSGTAGTRNRHEFTGRIG